ncbi:ammonia-dependent NAD(+) synthetase [Secundilactobacillus malefermentans]|uniref:ammonia-dependent NAD(+) synthetase n=1 Tax=Secundilactobacillus malefermentans TaxID=176292 RepID=UPI0011C82F61|nr:ammonia-dependent NAD(+) synthetase [Secundilactobacillus malefermentans]QEA31973.1 ammonia-dependent NAD(+) synthetase [Secundilactobacillus malefermentans]
MRKQQAEIISALHVLPEIDPQKEIRRSVDFLKAYLTKNSFLKSLVLGISGGQDSTLAGILSQTAITEIRNETGDSDYQFYAVRLPYGKQADEADAVAAIKVMKPDQVLRIDIQAMTDATEAAVAENQMPISDFNKGNVKARQRMVAQYAIAGEVHGAVVGTDHAAESVTGFYTKFGDGAADVTPLWRLDKRQGKLMLKELGVPAKLYEKVPTADLEDNRPALPDEVALGVTYQEIDDYLEGKEIKEKAAQTIENWYAKTQHKRHLPITVYDEFWK